MSNQSINQSINNNTTSNEHSINNHAIVCFAFDSYLQYERPHPSLTHNNKRRRKKKKGFELWIVMYLIRLLFTQCFIVVIRARVSCALSTLVHHLYSPKVNPSSLGFLFLGGHHCHYGAFTLDGKSIVK